MVVIKRDREGGLEVQHAMDHATERGVAWGLVGGAVIGLLFPPSILGSAALLGAGGAAAQRSREVHQRKEITEQLGNAIASGHAGVVALVSDASAARVRSVLSAAEAIVESTVDRALAHDLMATAKEGPTKDSSKDSTA